MPSTSNDRSTAQQRSDKSPSRAKLELRRQHKLLRRTFSARGTSAPARISASSDAEEHRSASPRRSLSTRSECWAHSPSPDSRHPRAQQRRRMERRCQSETCSSRYSNTKEALRHLCQIIASMDGLDGKRKADNFSDANLDPPITKQSLSELDIGSIAVNSKLRHDVNFDRELHFRPNLDGAKGKAKRRAQNDYWSALATELELYHAIDQNPELLAHPTVPRDVMRSACNRRIPRMFQAMKDILKALVPESDHPSVDDHLDVSLMMQEIEAGVCDLPRIARWMAHNLKAHCAPMRDHVIDKMVKYIDRGVTENSPKHLVEGLVQTFGAMEAMKLDVANHHIRQLRVVLIEDTINFEQLYHLDKIAHNHINLIRARLWYQEAACRLPQQTFGFDSTNPTAHSLLFPFLNALLDTLLSPAYESFPDTFKLDAERLKSIRSDLYDLFCIDACESVFLRLARSQVISYTEKDAFRSIISAIVVQSPYGSSWEENVDNIAAETARRLVALTGVGFHTAPTMDDGQLCTEAEVMLRQIFSDPSRSFFVARAEAAKQQMLSAIQDGVGRHLKSPLIEIFNNFLPSTGRLSQHRHSSAQPHNEESVMTDAVQRISHIAILHWRVWAPIVYLNGPPSRELPTRQHEAAAMPCSSQESPTASQFLASNSPMPEENPAETPTSHSEGESSASDVAEQTPRTITNLETQPSTEDSSSPVLYRQRTS